MTVAELIKRLEEMPRDAEVIRSALVLGSRINEVELVKPSIHSPNPNTVVIR
jgi:hypothetical protein